MTPRPDAPAALGADALRLVLDGALPIAREAAALLLDGWRSGAARARAKSRSDLVTDFDLRSEALLRERLAARFPEHAFVGEESAILSEPSIEGARPEALAWYVDPIDGTTNFAHGHPFFCVSIALVEHGDPVVGVVIAPALGLEWAGVRGGGATRNGAPLRVSETASLEDALLSTGFPAWRAEPATRARPDNNYRAFLALDAASHGVRRCGASAIEIAMVADGSYDAFWDLGLKPWDVAASSLFVREAGGVVSGFDGAPAAIDAGRIVASNGRVHDAIVRGLAGAVRLPPVAGLAPSPAADRLRTDGEVG